MTLKQVLDMDTLSAKEWAFKKIFSFIKLGGTAVPIEEKKRRRAICDGCELAGTVEPLPKFKIPGCTECGCPFVTKTALDMIPRLYKGEPLSVSELMELKVKGLLDPEQIEMEKIDCPHPDGSRWQ